MAIVQASRLQLILSAGLAAVFLYLSTRDVSWRDMVATASAARPNFLALALAILTGSYVVRSLRWRLLLSYVKQVAPLTVFWATMIGYLGNNFLPARAGEVLRTVCVGQATGISKSYVLATAATERITDFLFLALLGCGSVLWLRNAPSWLLGGSIGVGAIGLTGIAFVLLVPRSAPLLRRGASRLAWTSQVESRVVGLLDRFLLGLQALQGRERFLPFGALTALVWLTDALAAQAVAHALDLSISLPEVLVLLAALGVSSALPSTPGTLGVYQFVAVAVLTPFGYSSSQAIVYIVAFQAVIYASVVIWGGVGVWQMGRGLVQRQS